MRWLLVLLLAACSSTKGMGGPTMNNRLSSEEPEPPPPEIQSNDFLARDAVTNRAVVKHVLISWRGLEEAYGGNQDPRGARRSREEADQLAVAVLTKVRSGEDIEPLMAQLSEDPGSSADGRSYVVTPDEKFVFEFKRLSLRLNVGEAGLVMTQFGWHVIQRID